MYANFSKKEFHEWLIWYLHSNIIGENTIEPEEETLWVEFIKLLENRGVGPYLASKRFNVSMRVKSLGKSTNEKLLLLEGEYPVKIMF